MHPRSLKDYFQGNVEKQEIIKSCFKKQKSGKVRVIQF